jgi:hypothetical protein
MAPTGTPHVAPNGVFLTAYADAGDVRREVVVADCSAVVQEDQSFEVTELSAGVDLNETFELTEHPTWCITQRSLAAPLTAATTGERKCGVNNAEGEARDRDVKHERAAPPESVLTAGPTSLGHRA